MRLPQDQKVPGWSGRSISASHGVGAHGGIASNGQIAAWGGQGLRYCCGIVVVFVSRQQAGKEEIRDDRRRAAFSMIGQSVGQRIGDELETAAKAAAVF